MYYAGNPELLTKNTSYPNIPVTCPAQDLPLLRVSLNNQDKPMVMDAFSWNPQLENRNIDTAEELDVIDPKQLLALLINNYIPCAYCQNRKLGYCGQIVMRETDFEHTSKYIQHPILKLMSLIIAPVPNREKLTVIQCRKILKPNFNKPNGTPNSWAL